MSAVLGLRANVRQFALLVAVSALVGGMVGQERTVLPLLATDVFGLTGLLSALIFVVAFGIAKAFTNLAAGALADRFGRKPVLVAGWLVGLPVPILIRRPASSWSFGCARRSSERDGFIGAQIVPSASCGCRISRGSWSNCHVTSSRVEW